MIPANIDHASVIEDLNGWGIVDFKIEVICGLSRGYVDYLKKHPGARISYQLGARLYNFWHEERGLHESEGTQTLTATT